MDIYLKVLNWSLDTSQGRSACLPGCPSPRAWSAITRSALLLLLPVVAAFFAGTGAVMMRLRQARRCPARSASCSRLARRSRALGYGAAKLIGLLVGASAARLCRVARDRRRAAGMRACRIIGWRWSAPASRTLLLSVVLFGTLSTSFFPPQNDDFRASTSPCRRAHAEADRGGRRPRRRASFEGSERRARVRARQRRQRPREHRPQEGPQASRAPSSSAHCRRRLRRSPTPASASRARTAAGPTATRATSCSISAATIRCKLTAVANKIAKEMETRPRPARAARRQPARAARNHHQAALRPRRRSRRDDGGAQPDDPHRDARRHRAEQREILAVRPPGADQGLAVGKCAARPLDAREPAGADVERRLGSAEGGRRHRLRLRPDDDQPLEPAPPPGDRRRPRAGRGRRRRLGQGQPAADASRTCRRASRR